jgi:ubiquinone/menaquinone biosynthesis C-methylase UbiE
MSRSAHDHEAVTVDQFTHQAAPFAALHTANSDADILDLICQVANVGPEMQVLDVACGPALVARILARKARHVTGLDLTPAMLAQAHELARQEGLENLTWDGGRADALPYADEAFDVVVTRFSFHHLLEPAKSFAEMVRVCRPGGRVVVTDVYTTSPEQSVEYDRLEKLRDPSHVHALLLDELRALPPANGLTDVIESFARLPLRLEHLLAACFPVPGGTDEIRRVLAADIGRDRAGLGAHRKDGELWVSFPVLVIAGTRPSLSA